jgi:hypothetical protein
MTLILSACATPPKKTPAAPSPPAPPAAIAALDPSYDWHGLVWLPFGTVLKDSPLTLHEVLMFRDAAQGAQGDDAECYATQEIAPRFLKRTPREYLLCFRHDHLASVEATVYLPDEEAAQIFSDACGLWQKNAGAEGGSTAGSSACEGRDGAIAFGGTLEDNGDGTGRAVTMRLEALTQP